MDFFFDQIKRADNFNELKSRRLQAISNLKPLLNQNEILNEKKKQELLLKCQQMSSKMPQIISMLQKTKQNNDIKTAVNCVKYLADLLSILDVYNTSDDRLKIAEFIWGGLFKKIDDYGIAPDIISFVKENDHQLQYQVRKKNIYILYCFFMI